MATVTLQEQTASIPDRPLGYVLYVTRPYKTWAYLAIAAVILASATGQGTSYFFKIIVDAVEQSNYQTALWAGLAYPVAILIVQVMYRVSGYFGMKWTVLTRQKGYDDLCEYVLSHSNTYFADRFAGSILSKINNVVNAVDDTIPDFLWTHVNAAVSFIVTFGFMLFVDVTTALLFLALLVVLIVSNRWLAPEKARLSRENAESGTALRGRIVDMLANVAAVRQYVRKESEHRGIKEYTQRFADTNSASWLYTERMLLLNSILLFIFAFGMFWSLTYQWSLGNISAGDFVLVLSLVSQLTGTLLFIGRSFNDTARAMGELEEGLEDLLLPYEIIDKPEAGKLHANGGAIVWKDVSFQYGKNNVFDEFNLQILPEQRVGLVGPSGAGKTTFVSLLLRQHDIDKGAIEIDGQNIAHVTQDSLREHIAVVPQEPLLFHRTIRENIAYGKSDATENEIMAVARQARVHEFVKSLPEGYETLVGERGVKLSGGQKQRIAIARAMLKDAPVLILDEATSALDSESEVGIQKALHKLMVGKTVVAIAHRLSTLREMDRIIVLENGKVVEDGSHDALVNYGGVYAKLWQHQAGGFLQD